MGVLSQILPFILNSIPRKAEKGKQCVNFVVICVNHSQILGTLICERCLFIC